MNIFSGRRPQGRMAEFFAFPSLPLSPSDADQHKGASKQSAVEGNFIASHNRKCEGIY
jgi:hypothetical protein